MTWLSRFTTTALLCAMMSVWGCGIDLSGVELTDADAETGNGDAPQETAGEDALPRNETAQSSVPATDDNAQSGGVTAAPETPATPEASGGTTDAAQAIVDAVRETAAEATAAFARPAYADVNLETEIESFEEAFATDAQAIVRARRQYNSVPLTRRNRLPTGEEVVIQADVDADYLQYRLGVVADYEALTADTGAAREAGRRYVDAYARLAAGAPDAVSLDELLALGDAATEAGAEDPIVRVFYERIRMDRTEVANAAEHAYLYFHEIAPELKRDGYPAGVSVLIRQWLHDLAVRLELPPETVERHTYEVMDAAVRLFQESSDENQRFVRWQLYFFLQDLSMELREDLICACLAADGVPDWQIHLLAGQQFRDLAWQHRGSGFANTVSEEGWRKFAGYLQRSGRHYTRAWFLAPELPDAAAEMIAVSMGGGDTDWTPRDWFQRAVTAQLDYEPAFDKLIWAMTPRWGGSHTAQLRFARECLETERWDSNVPSQASAVLWSIQKEIGDERPFGENPDAVEVAELYVERLTEARQRFESIPADSPGMLGQMAGILVQGQKYEPARQLFESDDERIQQHDFDWSWMKKSYARGLVYARTGPAAESVSIFEELLNDPLPEDVEPAVFTEFLDMIAQSRSVDSGPEANQYYDDIESVVHQLQAFHAGEWAELTFDANLSGWYAMGEQVEVIDERTARLASTAEFTGVQLTPMAPFPPPFEVEAEFATWSEGGEPQWVGITLGTADRRALYARDRRRSVLMAPTANFAFAIIDPTSNENNRESAGLMGDDPFKRLGLSVQTGRIGFLARGEQFAQDGDYPFEPTGALTFGEVLPADNPAAFQIRNVRIRKPVGDAVASQ